MSVKTRKLFYFFPWHLSALLVLLLAAGLANLHSATSTGADGTSSFFKSQLHFALVGLGLLAAMLSFHYRRLLGLAWPIYLVSLVLLALVVVFGKEMGGQKNWLVAGGFRMQPSELAKLAVIIMLARYFHLHPRPEGYGLKDLRQPLLIVALPLVLILAVKDVGSALFFVLIGVSFCFLVGLKFRWILIGLALGLVLAGGAYRYFLSDYQRGRIQTFLEPEADPRGKGYHLIQSKIAVGSGQLFGKGYLKGNLNKLKFLPERHTDFVFPVLAEEWGFAGSAAVLAAFAALFLLLLHAAGKVKDSFGGYLILGVTALLFWQAIVNLGGVLGLLPLAGVTLPFLSYGGSALLTSLLGLGMAFNAYTRRYIF